MKKSLLAAQIASIFSLMPRMAGDGGVQLEMSYPSLDNIPEAFRGLYSEDNGAFKLTGVVGVKTQDDINRLQEALNKERNDHKTVKGDLTRLLGGRTADEILADLDSIPALKAAAAGNDPKAVEDQVNARLQQATAPLQRQIAELNSQLEAASQSVAELKTREVNRTITDVISKAAMESKALPEAIEDIAFMGRNMFEVNESGEVVAKNDIPGLTPGVSAQVWLTEMKRAKPYFWPQSQGAGGRGGQGNLGGNNPFSKEGWNLTEQGALISRDRSLAEQMAKQAGTTVGGPRPA